MDDKAKIAMLLANLVVKKAGEIIKDSAFAKHAENGGAFNIYPVKGSAATVLPGNEIVKVLKETFPKAVFTFFTKALPKIAEAVEKTEKTDKDAK